MTSTYSLINAPQRATEHGVMIARQYEQQLLALSRRAERMARDHGKRLRTFWMETAEAQRRLARSADGGQLATDWEEYSMDSAQRMALALDALRERANQDAGHEAAGTPPVLIYDHEVILDGRTLPRPTNKVLLNILAPAGIEVKSWKRPYMIVDPRAGHGAGIGGFKTDSQVGVAARRPSGLFCHIPAAPRAGANAGRRHARRS
jgi:hypothetical protein